MYEIFRLNFLFCWEQIDVKKKELKTNHQPFECWIQNDLKKSNCSSVPLFFIHLYLFIIFSPEAEEWNWLID